MVEGVVCTHELPARFLSDQFNPQSGTVSPAPMEIGRPLPESLPAMEILGWKELGEGKPTSWAMMLKAPSTAPIPGLPAAWTCMEAPHHPLALLA